MIKKLNTIIVKRNAYKRIIAESNCKEVVKEILTKRLRVNEFGVAVSEVYFMANELLK